MWISKSAFEKLLNQLEEWKGASAEAQQERRSANDTSVRLLIENERLRADLDWFKLRMNAVEKERQMLMMDRIGVKIPIPEFMAAKNLPDELDAMNAMPDLSMIGEDAPSDFNPAKELGPDYSGLPVRANN